MRIGIVVGEPSGDNLGADLIKALREQLPELQVEGVCGPQLIAQGATALVDSERLAVMGITAVLGRLPELFGIKRRIQKHFITHPPDVFIGVDAPDFNLPLERKLKAAGIPTIHYVSPTVWAWREKRVHKIAAAVDLVLSIFPFEVDFFTRYNVPVRYVGYPLADAIPQQVDMSGLRGSLKLPSDKHVVAVLPGSRQGEMHYLGRVFVETMLWLAERRPDVHFVVPLASARLRVAFERELKGAAANTLNLTLVDGHSRDAMGSADVVLSASGTATMEALLLKKPLVVAYRMSALTVWIIRALGLMNIQYYAMPNILAGEQLAGEFIQENARADLIGPAVLELLQDSAKAQNMRTRFAEIRKTLQRDASHCAAQAVIDLVRERIK